jgi:hypothetical protein
VAKSEDKKQNKERHSPTLVSYPSPEKVDREFYDLHGIPYPQNDEEDLPRSESPRQT